MLKRILGTAAVLFMAGIGAAAAAGNVVVTQVSGDAQIGADTMKPAATGAACQTNDRLKTAGGAQMDIALNGVAGCRLLESSSVRLVSTGAEGMKLSVEEGNVILNLETLPAGSTFELETPTAVASVRGTQFWGRVLSPAEAGKTTFAVREGSVHIRDKASGKNFNLGPSQALDLSKDALPEVRPALEAELQAMKQASDIATSV